MSLIVAPEDWRSRILGKQFHELDYADLERLIPQLMKRRADLMMSGANDGAPHGVLGGGRMG